MNTQTFYRVFKPSDIGRWKIGPGPGLLKGRWREEAADLETVPHVLTDFLKCEPSETAIVRFTQKYGVLCSQWTDHAGTFTLLNSEWVKRQQEFQQQWELATKNKADSVLDWLQKQFTPPSEDRVVSGFGQPIKLLSSYLDPRNGPLALEVQLERVRGTKAIATKLVAGDLWQGLCLMFLDVLGRNPGYTIPRICENENCKVHYPATRAKQRYCTPGCCKRVADRRYWNSPGARKERQRRAKKKALAAKRRQAVNRLD